MTPEFLKQKTPEEILKEMHETFVEKAGKYGDSYVRVGNTLTAMFPYGIHLKTADDFMRFHLFCMKISKLCRFSISGLTHIDSIHDDAVYGAILQSTLNNNTKPLKGK